MPRKMRKNIALFLVKGRTIVKEAMKKMDKASEKILFVVSKDNKLLGSLTDGDIRRWILNEGMLSESIGKVFNRQPIFVNEDYNVDEIKEIMINKKIGWIPVVDERHKIIDILLWEDIFKRKQETKNNLNIPVIIMAGGKGLRLSPFTKILPKPLVPIGDKPVSEVIMERFNEYGCSLFYFILGYKADMVKVYFHKIGSKYKLNYIQEERPLGTSGGLNLLPKGISENFFVTNCDTVIKADYSDIYKFHTGNKCDMTLIGSVQHFRVPYGVIEVDKQGSLKEITEKPEYDFLASTGMYILNKNTLNLIPKGKIFHITDLVNTLKKKGRRIGVYPVSNKSWLDVGQWEEYKKAIEKLEFFK